jgi:uncharacterized protein
MLISYAWLEVGGLKIRFMEILQPTEIREKVGPLTLEFGHDYEVRVEPVPLTVLVEPVQAGHRLDGGFDYRASVPCSRCLEEAVLEGSATFLLEYQPAHQAPIPEEETEVALEEVQVLYYEEPELALEDLVIQQMYLEIPEKALCQPDCKGLCPRCGANLNQGPCPCPPETDSRWTALGQFQKKS